MTIEQKVIAINKCCDYQDFKDFIRVLPDISDSCLLDLFMNEKSENIEIIRRYYNYDEIFDMVNEEV